jgi:hypothetical protein
VTWVWRAVLGLLLAFISIQLYRLNVGDLIHSSCSSRWPGEVVFLVATPGGVVCQRIDYAHHPVPG